jgi:multimeric flavodoxin WrbA
MANKNVLVLAGSPRKNGNSEMMADAFIKGAEKSGCAVHKIRVAALNIHGCTACNQCWNLRQNCIFDDGMREIEPLLEAADVLVIATPLYWSMVPAQVKAVIDRLYQYDPANGAKHLHIQESILLACGETADASDFDMIKKFFTMVSAFNGMKVRDMIVSPATNAKGDVAATGLLSIIEKLGESIV